MHLFFQAGKKKNLLKIILATVIAIFIIITLFISFNNYFVGNLQGFILSPNFVYEGSDLNLILSLRKSSDGEPVSGAKISIKEIAEKLRVTPKTIQRDLDKMKDKNIISRIGADKGGFWEICKR